MLDLMMHVTPLVNTALLFMLVFALPVIYLKLRAATPLAIRAEVDLVSRHMGELRRAQKDLERELGSIRHERKQLDIKMNDLHGRITGVSEDLAGRLDDIKASLASLACSEANWHRDHGGSMFCPLRQRDCPLNDKDGSSE